MNKTFSPSAIQQKKLNLPAPSGREGGEDMDGVEMEDDPDYVPGNTERNYSIPDHTDRYGKKSKRVDALARASRAGSPYSTSRGSRADGAGETGSLKVEDAAVLRARMAREKHETSRKEASVLATARAEDLLTRRKQQDKADQELLDLMKKDPGTTKANSTEFLSGNNLFG